MYSANLVSTKADSQFPEISVSTIQFFKDGVAFGDPDIERGLTKEQLKRYCKDKVKKLTEDEAQKNGMAELITSPEIGEIDLSNPEPTPEEQAKSDYNTKLQAAKQALELAALKASPDPAVIAAVADLTDLMPVIKK